jgi:hypothetical protein
VGMKNICGDYCIIEESKSYSKPKTHAANRGWGTLRVFVGEMRDGKRPTIECRKNKISQDPELKDSEGMKS